MSRIGKLAIRLPAGVKITSSESSVQINGPGGTMVQDLPQGISCSIQGDCLEVKRSDDGKRQRALHGLMRSLIANAVRGVHTGFTRKLQIEGIGYRAQIQGQDLTLTLGFSHPVKYSIPDGVKVKVENQTAIAVSGVDRSQVGQVASEIRSLRPPEPYKGKGIRYADEQIKRKVGKTGA